MWRKLGLIILLVAVLYKGRVAQLLTGLEPLYDFDTYYQTASDVFLGSDPHSLEYMQTAGPPLVIIPYLPFILLDLNTARISMTLLSLVAGFISAWLLAESFFKNKLLDKYIKLNKIDWFLVISLVLWATFPARFTLGLGQPNIVLMLLATYLMVGKTSALKDQALAVLALIKTNFLILFVSYWKRPHAWFATAMIIGAVLLATPIIKPSYYQNYFSNRASSYIFSPPNLTDLDYYNQSTRSLMGRLSLDSLAPIIFLAIGLGSAIYLFLSTDYKTGILLSILASPIVWQHYFVVVFPVACLLMIDYFQKKSWKLWPVGFFFALTVIEIPHLHVADRNFINSLLASHYLIGLIGLTVFQINIKNFSKV